MSEPNLALLQGDRRERYTYVLRDARTLERIGMLDGVTGGSLDYSIFNTIKSGGSLVYEGAEPVDWLNVLIQPWYSATSRHGSVTWPLGVFIPATPGGTNREVGQVVDVELYDRLTVLVEDKSPDTYSISQGTHVTSAITEIIETAVPGAQVLMDPSEDTLRAGMVWDAGTTMLQIANDLLDSINFFSLYCDGEGVFRGDAYTSPASRPLEWEFRNGATAIHEGTYGLEEDLFSVPNRFIVLTPPEEEETASLKAVAQNIDPGSRFSYQARGRWITQVEEGVEAPDQATLDAIAQRRLEAAMQVSATVELLHAPLDLSLNGRVRFTDTDKGRDLTGVIQSRGVDLTPGALNSLTIKEILT